MTHVVVVLQLVSKVKEVDEVGVAKEVLIDENQES
jgi:hypothetical protein